MNQNGTAQKKEKKKSAVRLYAGPTTAEATARTEGFRFSRIAASYTLVYTGKPKAVPEGFIEITEEDAHRLTDADRQWLTDCQTALIVEHIQAQRPAIEERLSELLNIVEQITQEGGELSGESSSEQLN